MRKVTFYTTNNLEDIIKAVHSTILIVEDLEITSEHDKTTEEEA